MNGDGNMNSNDEFRAKEAEEILEKIEGVVSKFKGKLNSDHSIKAFNKSRLETTNEWIRTTKKLNEKSITCYSYGCNNKVANNHLFSKNWIERELGDNKKGVVEIRRPSFAKRKLTKASTFNFLCSECDKKMFKAIDSIPLSRIIEDLKVNNMEMVNVLALRSLMAAYTLSLDSFILNKITSPEEEINEIDESFINFYIAEKSLRKNKKAIQDLALGLPLKSRLKKMDNKVYIFNSEMLEWDMLFFMHYEIKNDLFVITTSIKDGDKTFIIVSNIKITDAKNKSKKVNNGVIENLLEFILTHSSQAQIAVVADNGIKIPLTNNNKVGNNAD